MRFFICGANFMVSSLPAEGQSWWTDLGSTAWQAGSMFVTVLIMMGGSLILWIYFCMLRDVHAGLSSFTINWGGSFRRTRHLQHLLPKKLRHTKYRVHWVWGGKLGSSFGDFNIPKSARSSIQRELGNTVGKWGSGPQKFPGKNGTQKRFNVDDDKLDLLKANKRVSSSPFVSNIRLKVCV